MIALAALGCWIAFLLIAAPPWGNFPIADDWMYAESVRWLLDGRLRISEFAAPAAITNIVWGWFFSLPIGLSHTVLRVSTIAASALALIAFDRVLREAGVPSSRRYFACALLAVNPLFLATSYTFQTDVLFLALFLFSCWAVAAALRRRSTARLALASVSVLLAALSRQIGLAPSLVGAYYLRREKAKRADYFALLALPVGGFVAHILWFRYVHGMTHGQSYHLHQSLIRLRDPGRLAAETFARLGACVQYAGWMLVPAAIASLPRKPRVPSFSRRKALALAAGIGLWALALFAVGPIPALGDQINRLGLGTVAVPGAAFKDSGWWSSAWLWLCVNLLSLAGLLILAYRWDEMNERRLRLLGAATALAFAPALLSFSFFDRYLLLLIPAGAAFAASKDLPRPALGWAVIAVFAVFSIAGLNDMMSWNRALWQLGASSTHSGVNPDQIMGGLSWDGEHIAEKNLEILRTRKPVESIRPYEWREMNSFRALISFSPQAPEAAVRSSEIHYATPFDPSGGSLYFYIKQ